MSKAKNDDMVHKLRFILKSFKGFDLIRFLTLLLTNKLFWITQRKSKIILDEVKYEFNLNFRNSIRRLFIRRQDVATFFEVFYEEIYHHDKLKNNTAYTIVDLGAHIGLTSLFFKMSSPSSRIIGVEPSDGNAAIYKMNCPDAELINVAITNRNGRVHLNTSSKSQNHKLHEIGQSVSSITLTTLSEQMNLNQTDILKIDIEGAESLLMESIEEWQSKVKFIFIECHNNEEYILAKLHKSGIEYKLV